MRMWTKSEKNLVIGVGFGVWGCVISVNALGALLSTVAIIYFSMSIYSSFKGD